MSPSEAGVGDLGRLDLVGGAGAPAHDGFAACDDRERDDGGPDRRRHPHVQGARPGRELGDHVDAPDRDLADEEHAGQRGEPDQAVGARTHRACANAQPEHEGGDEDREHPVREHLGGAARPERRHQAAAHQRPVPEREPGALGAHVRADEQQRERRDRRDHGEPRVPAVAGPVVALERQRRGRHQHAEHDHREPEVQRDHGGIELAVHDRAAEGPLHAEERHERDRHPDRSARRRGRPPTTGAHELGHADHGEGHGEQPRDHPEGPVHVLDQRVVLPPGHPAAEARGPVGASVARTGRAHDAAPHDQRERGDRRGDCQLLEPGHRVLVWWGRRRAGRRRP